MKIHRILLIFISLLISATALYVAGGYSKTRCYWPFCRDYEYVVMNVLEGQFDALLITLQGGSSQVIKTNSKKALVTWRIVPDQKNTRYGGLVYSSRGDKFIFLTQFGRFFDVSLDGMIVENTEIPELKISSPKLLPSYAKEGRVGVRDLFLDPSDGSLTVAISSVDEQNDCHFLSVHFLELNTKEWEDLYKTPCWNFGRMTMVGGAIVKKENFIYLTTGENHFLPRKEIDSRDYESIFDNLKLGKIVRINVDNRESEVYSHGFRNPQGFAISTDGNLFTIEHGPKGGDELNKIRKGHHYGFPKITLGVSYGEKSWLWHDEREYQKFTPPLYSFVPSVAPSDLIFNESYVPLANLTDCEILVTTLRAKSLFFIRLNNNCSSVQNIEEVTVGKRLRKIAIKNGEQPIIALSTDMGNEIAVIKFE